MSETLHEFKGKAGRIYIQRADDSEMDEGGRRMEVWFEDFCILRLGHTEVEALDDAWSHTGDIMALISEARLKLSDATPSGE